MEKDTKINNEILNKLKKQSIDNISFGLQFKLTISIVILMFIIISLRTAVLGYVNSYLDNPLFINIASAIISILLGALGAIFIIRTFIKKPLAKLMTLAEHYLKNEFSKQIDMKTNDEFGQLATVFNDVGKKLQLIINEISDSSNQVFEFADQVNENTKQIELSANEVSSAIQEIAQGSELQAQSADESANAVEEMATGIQTVSESAAEIAKKSVEMRKNAREGKNVVNNAIEHMNKINEEYIETSTNINYLEQDSDEIGEITIIISDIADQINLLALNAAIEAARAGEHGRGFAVVADEVRKLSDETSASISKIESLVERIQKNVKTSAESMDKEKVSIDKGTMNISAIKEMFETILTSIETITEEVENLSSVSEEMSASSEEVASSLEEVASTAKQSSDNANRVAASSEEQLAIIDEVALANNTLLNMATDLKKLVDQFKI